MHITSHILGRAIQRGIAPQDPRFAGFIRDEGERVEKQQADLRVRGLTLGSHFHKTGEAVAETEFRRLGLAVYGRTFEHWARGDSERVVIYFNNRAEGVFDRRGARWQRIL